MKLIAIASITGIKIYFYTVTGRGSNKPEIDYSLTLKK